MSDVGEIAELLKGSYARNPKRVIKSLISEHSIQSELIENLEENWSDFDGWFGFGLDKNLAVTAGTIYMRTDYRAELFTENGSSF